MAEQKNMLFPLRISRQYGASLDANYEFATLDELKTYAIQSALAYPGQILYCVEEDALYKVNADKTDATEITAGEGGEAYTEDDWQTFYSALEIDNTTGGGD